MTESRLTRIHKNSRIPQKNKKLLDDWVAFLKGPKALKSRSVALRVYAAEYFLNALGNVEADKARREDINRVVGKIRHNEVRITKLSKGLNARTQEEVISSAMEFEKFVFKLGKLDGRPDNFKEIEFRKVKRSILPEDLLQEADIVRMLNVCDNLRDRAFISILYDTGARIGELLELRLKDITWASTTNITATIRLSGEKTEEPRSVPIIFSVPYVQQYLDSMKDEIKPDEIIWKYYKTVWDGKDRVFRRKKIGHGAQHPNLQYDEARKLLSDIAVKAKIDKRVNPHAFRHARATIYAQHMPEQVLRKQFGWSNDSKTPSLYIHLSTKDLQNAVLRAHNIKVEDKSSFIGTELLKTKTCPKCKLENRADMIYCPRCGTSLDAKYVAEERKEISLLNERIDKLAQMLAQEFEDKSRSETFEDAETFRKMKDEEDAKEIQKVVLRATKGKRKASA